MPAYSFKLRFVAFVLDGSKLHTIRKRRKKGFAKTGDRIFLYYGLRTAQCRKLAESSCINTCSIAIDKNGEVYLFNQRLNDADAAAVEADLKNGGLPNPSDPALTWKVLSSPEKNTLAWNDGFRDADYRNFRRGVNYYSIMLRWWKLTNELPFVGDIIYWDTKNLIKNQP